MAEVLNFYMDDSGARHPDRKPGKRPAHGYDWFALGGILVKQSDEEEARRLHAEFCEDWSIDFPIHSVEIRGTTSNFSWLVDIEDDDRDRFYEDLYQLMREAPVIGLACVIDRPGYNDRYKEKYGEDRWQLCKTAFTVAVERAAKYADESTHRLRVAPERCNKPEDALLKAYYEALKEKGLPFDAATSEKYKPFAAADFQRVLYEFRPKYKSSPMAQLADLFLWPICMGGYHASNRTYRRLQEDGKLIECVIEEAHWPMRATKYSCFDNVKRKP